MKYRFYTKSDKAWAAMLEAIRGARKSILLESFILTDDPKTHQLFETLKEKAKAGVKVKIIIDRLAHFWFGSINRDAFTKAGAEVVVYNHWFYRNHRKTMIVDEEIGFAGGVNIRGAYAKWLDLHMMITGLFVKRLLSSFARAYYLSGGRDPEILAFRKLPLGKLSATIYKAKTWLIERWPLRGKDVLKHYYKQKFAQASQSITIVTPYFIPHKWLMRALRQAAGRGVKIEVIIPQKTDIAAIDLIHRPIAEHLSSWVNFYFMKRMNHAKVLLVDEKEGLVGSNNIDAQSFDYNLEASVIFQRKDMIGDLKKIIAEWKSEAVPLSELKEKSHWYHRILIKIIHWLEPIL